jgi:hypothetical protein
MKKLFLGVVMLLSFATLNAQTKPTTTPAVVASVASFDKVKHSFGKIKQGTPQSISFTLKNTSSKPLIIEQATAQCGCTTPEYSKAPILKGKSTPIKVTYNAANAGPFTKTVTVKFLNIPEPTVLTIEGEVLKGAEPVKKEK